MLEKHKFLSESDPRLQDMIKMFKEEELLSSVISPFCSVENKSTGKRKDLKKRTSSMEMQQTKKKCLEKLCLVIDD